MLLCIINNKKNMEPWHWLIFLRFCGSLRQHLNLYRAVLQREGKRKETDRADQSKNIQTIPILHMLQAQQAFDIPLSKSETVI